MTQEEMMKWIDQASYEQLLSKWRFSSAGSPWFQDQIGDYYAMVMRRREEEMSNDERVRASKNVGWER